jgi:nucleoside 2-deoxyribosyltransferase
VGSNPPSSHKTEKTMKNPIKLYLAGPMSGLPDMNYPEFNRVAALLRAKGYEAMNPAENPEPLCKSWAGYMRLAIAQLVQSDGVALLDGWDKSKGAQMELSIASQLDIPYRGADLILCNENVWQAP